MHIMATDTRTQHEHSNAKEAPDARAVLLQCLDPPLEKSITTALQVWQLIAYEDTMACHECIYMHIYIYIGKNGKCIGEHPQ